MANGDDEERGNFEEARAVIEQAARELVGRIGLKGALALMRTCMHREALRKAGGSRRAAARILEVDRRYVQRLANGPRRRSVERESEPPWQGCAELARSGR